MDRKTFWISSVVGSAVYQAIAGTSPYTVLLQGFIGGAYLLGHWLLSGEARQSLKRRLRPGG